jgi:hypothetical protein
MSMKIVMSVLVLLLSLIIGAPASAQLGTVNPHFPAALPPASLSGPLPPSYPPVSQPNPLHNAHSMQPNAGVITTGGLGVPFRQIWVPPQAVPIIVYDQHREGTGEQWVTQYTELPGYYVTETTLGYLYPDRWTLVSSQKGIYQWQRVPAAFRPK